MVTGVLPLALEEATKTIQAFLLTGKEYTCIMTLHGDVDLNRLHAVLEDFVGEVLQVGAHMRELRRTRAGSFTEADASSLYNVLELSQSTGDEKEIMARRIVKPMESAFDYVHRVYMRDSAVSSICHGADLAIPGIVRLSNGILPRMPIALFTLKDELVALSRAIMSSEQMLKEEHGMAAKTVRVIMPPDTYPRMWKTKPAPTVQVPS